MDTHLKICVVGPCRSGKTLVCKILGRQTYTWAAESYAPTRALRIQHASVVVDMERVPLQLWDCSGDVQYRKYWTLFAEDTDGLLMVFHPEDESNQRLMEKLYKDFARKQNLDPYCVQLMALRTDMAEDAASVARRAYFEGKLKELSCMDVSISAADMDLSSKILIKHLRPFLKECLKRKHRVLQASSSIVQ